MTSTSLLEPEAISETVFTRDLTRSKNHGLGIYVRGGISLHPIAVKGFKTNMHSETIINLEKDMAPVKRSMEERGLNVDLVKLENLMRQNAEQKDAIEQELKDAFGVKENCNFNSSRDVSKILLSHLGVKPRVTQTGRLSTNRRMLKDLSNPVTDKIIRYREIEKLLSALKAIEEATDKTRSKIFCRYLDNCPSGRIYSQGYSFQSISEVARAVIVADEGCSFILVDYDSFELRILSALSHDKYFKDCWTKGLDLHRKVVADMKGIRYESVTDKERKLGKILNFGIAYGQEPSGLARNLYITTYEAQKLMATYKNQIPEIEAFKTEAIQKARKDGFVSTYYGRKRFLQNILSPDSYDRKKAERQVVNHMIQGTGADIAKFALVNLHREGFALSTFLHDGVLITVPDSEVEQSIDRIRAIMEVEIEGTKFPVSFKSGKCWSDCYKKSEHGSSI